MNPKDIDPVIATLICAIMIAGGVDAIKAGTESVQIAGAVSVLAAVVYGVWNARHKKELIQNTQDPK